MSEQDPRDLFVMAEESPAAAETTGRSDVEAVLAERTADLQRLQAEFVNYKRRVERDRDADAARATIRATEPLLGILDDIDRAESHGELVGGFKAVAERLRAELTGLGLEKFGQAGDVFDPQWHSAVAHLPAGDVTEPVCLDVVTPGYTYRGTLVRPATVAVATPISD